MTKTWAIVLWAVVATCLTFCGKNKPLQPAVEDALTSGAVPGTTSSGQTPPPTDASASNSGSTSEQPSIGTTPTTTDGTPLPLTNPNPSPTPSSLNVQIASGNPATINVNQNNSPVARSSAVLFFNQSSNSTPIVSVVSVPDGISCTASPITPSCTFPGAGVYQVYFSGVSGNQAVNAFATVTVNPNYPASQAVRRRQGYNSDTVLIWDYESATLPRDLANYGGQNLLDQGEVFRVFTAPSSVCAIPLNRVYKSGTSLSKPNLVLIGGDPTSYINAVASFGWGTAVNQGPLGYICPSQMSGAPTGLHAYVARYGNVRLSGLYSINNITGLYSLPANEGSLPLTWLDDGIMGYIP